MGRLLRLVLKLAVLGAIAAVVVKVLQNRSHPDGVVDRNAYNPSPWTPLDDQPGPAKQPAAPAEKAPEAQPAPPKKAAAKKAPAAKKKAPAKKAPAKKQAAATKKAPAAKKKAPGKKAPPKKA